MPRRLARNDGRKMAHNDVKPVVVARSKASAERRGNLAKSLSGGREGLLRRLARNDGRKMIRNNTGGRDCHAYWLAMTESRLARNDTGGRDCHAYWLAMTESRLARNDEKPAGSQ